MTGGGLIRQVIAVAAALAFAIGVRVFLFSIYVIPTGSMVPTLLPGDVVVVAKWPYGWSGDGGPLAPRLWHGRLRPTLPERGDIAVFKAPPAGRLDYVKRAVGLPGDEVALRDGIVTIDRRPLAQADGVETGLDGRRHLVLDRGRTEADTFGPVAVPAGRMFVLGDDRDRSADSRFPARDGGGVGMVPLDALVGRPILVLLSTDGSARLADPKSWWRSIRRGRIALPL